MDFINLTPHPIKVQTSEGTKNFEPSGEIARVNVEETPAGDIDGIPLKIRKTGNPVGLPPSKDGALYIVSSMVLSSSDRSDLIAPDTGSSAVRDESGKIQAVRGFVANSKISSNLKEAGIDWVGMAMNNI